MTFSSLGRVVPNADASPTITQIDIDNPTIPVAADRRVLRILIPAGGAIRLCDPNPNVAATDPRSVPAEQTTMTPKPSGQQGVILLEALIGILIFSLGVLALVAMQAVSVSNVSNARYRTEAAFLANEIISEIWVDRGPGYSNVANYSRLERQRLERSRHDLGPEGARAASRQRHLRPRRGHHHAGRRRPPGDRHAPLEGARCRLGQQARRRRLHQRPLRARRKPPS